MLCDARVEDDRVASAALRCGTVESPLKLEHHGIDGGLEVRLLRVDHEAYAQRLRCLSKQLKPPLHCRQEQQLLLVECGARERTDRAATADEARQVLQREALGPLNVVHHTKLVARGGAQHGAADGVGAQRSVCVRRIRRRADRATRRRCIRQLWWVGDGHRARETLEQRLHLGVAHRRGTVSVEVLREAPMPLFPGEQARPVRVQRHEEVADTDNARAHALQ